MSLSLNRAQFIGHVGGDPEIRALQGSSRVAQFSLATSRSWTGEGGEKQEKTQWHRCVVFDIGKRKLVEFVEVNVRKGARLYVEGEVEYRQWQDKDGGTRHTTEIKVREIFLLGGARDAEPRAEASAPRRESKKASRDGDPQDDLLDFPAALKDDDDDLPF